MNSFSDWILVAALTVVLSITVIDTEFEQDQCGYFRAAVVDNMIAAGRGDKNAQKTIALYQEACTSNQYTCIDDLMPGHALRCEVFNGD